MVQRTNKVGATGGQKAVEQSLKTYYTDHESFSAVSADFVLINTESSTLYLGIVRLST